jgi:hypothetical protein
MPPAIRAGSCSVLQRCALACQGGGREMGRIVALGEASALAQHVQRTQRRSMRTSPVTSRAGRRLYATAPL